MADDNTFQAQRASDLNPRAAQPRLSSSEADDALAELARLIGQSQSFTQFARSNSRGEQTAQPAPTLAPEPWQYAATGPEQIVPSSRDDVYASSQHFIGSPIDEAQADADLSPYEQPDLVPDHQQYADDPGFAHEEHGGTDFYSQDDVPLEPQEDATYDDPPPVRRRGALVTALVLIGCAFLGTAGAYAYRSFYGHARATQPPPIIAADTSAPIKIVPATAGDPQSGKPAQERVADAGKEQLVSKQEEPVSLKEATGQPAPRPVVPTTPAVPVATAAPATQPPTAAAPANASNEPKKVRTVTIRPEGGDASGRPAGISSGAPGAAAPARSTASASASRGPLSLDAQIAEAPAAPPSRTRTAAAPSSGRSASEGSSGFVVQLSSQKTESEAQASFRSLQGKFPNELGGRQPIIRRVDLGSKGVFYRTMVGPFASAHEASQFCANYKASGGQCMVPNN
jgi:hypothetical protein